MGIEVKVSQQYCPNTDTNYTSSTAHRTEGDAAFDASRVEDLLGIALPEGEIVETYSHDGGFNLEFSTGSVVSFDFKGKTEQYQTQDVKLERKARGAADDAAIEDVSKTNLNKLVGFYLAIDGSYGALQCSQVGVSRMTLDGVLSLRTYLMGQD